jgi:hypothetical protein
MDRLRTDACSGGAGEIAGGHAEPEKILIVVADDVITRSAARGTDEMQFYGSISFAV